jgi:hypothetical protein
MMREGFKALFYNIFKVLSSFIIHNSSLFLVAPQPPAGEIPNPKFQTKRCPSGK